MAYRPLYRLHQHLGVGLRWHARNIRRRAVRPTVKLQADRFHDHGLTDLDRRDLQFLWFGFGVVLHVNHSVTMNAKRRVSSKPAQTRHEATTTRSQNRVGMARLRCEKNFASAFWPAAARCIRDQCQTDDGTVTRANQKCSRHQQLTRAPGKQRS